MTNTRDDQLLSSIELLVLARMLPKEGVTEGELIAALADLAPSDGPLSARDQVADALEALRKRSFATTPAPTKRSPRPRSKATEDGRRALRAALGVDWLPHWGVIRARYLPALALGIPSTSKQASELGNTDELVLETLRLHFGISQASTTIALCDALIAKALGFTSGPVTLLRLRAHVLAREFGLEPRVASTYELEALASRAASKSVDESGDGKRPLRQALGRRWAYRVTTPVAVSPSPIATLSTPPPSPTSPPIRVMSSSPDAPRTTGPTVVSADTLLTLVREAIPRIGSNGRFGPEKVFVSALWRYIEDDGRLPDLSLERFKTWLVTANRDQLVDLARADVLGEMDGQLVEESEIRDLGATFHFVVDRRVAAVGRGYHAR